MPSINFDSIPERRTYPRAPARLNCSEGYQRAFDRFIRKHRDWYGSILVRWESWQMGVRMTRSQEEELKLSMIQFNQHAFCFRAVLPDNINQLTLRQRRLNWERLCSREGYDLEVNQDDGWRPGETDAERLNAPHSAFDTRYIVTGDTYGTNYTYVLEHASDDYDDDSGKFAPYRSVIVIECTNIPFLF